MPCTPPFQEFHTWHALWFCPSHMRRTFLSLGFIVLALASGACREEGTVTVHSLRFEGVKAVDEARLKSVLATRQS